LEGKGEGRLHATIQSIPFQLSMNVATSSAASCFRCVKLLFNNLQNRNNASSKKEQYSYLPVSSKDIDAADSNNKSQAGSSTANNFNSTNAQNSYSAHTASSELQAEFSSVQNNAADDWNDDGFQDFDDDQQFTHTVQNYSAGATNNSTNTSFSSSETHRIETIPTNSFALSTSAAMQPYTPSHSNPTISQTPATAPSNKSVLSSPAHNIPKFAPSTVATPLSGHNYAQNLAANPILSANVANSAVTGPAKPFAGLSIKSSAKNKAQGTAPTLTAAAVAAAASAHEPEIDFFSAAGLQAQTHYVEPERVVPVRKPQQPVVIQPNYSSSKFTDNSENFDEISLNSSDWGRDLDLGMEFPVAANSSGWEKGQASSGASKKDKKKPLIVAEENNNVADLDLQF
jgi:hypothetical protein